MGALYAWVWRGFRFGCRGKGKSARGASLARLKSGHYNGEEKGKGARSTGGPKPKLRPMQPRPRAETSKLLFPSLRFCIVSPSDPVSLIPRLESNATEAVARSFRFIS